MKKRGFTLVELLTVIAIIAILAAIIFPVAGSARERARRAQCISNLSQIGTAIKQYKLTEGGYPPALMGYVEPYTGTQPGGDPKLFNGSNPTPADQIRFGYLMPDQIKSVGLFKCPNNTKSRSNVENTQQLPTGTTPDVYWPAIQNFPGSGAVAGFNPNTALAMNLRDAVSSNNPKRTYYTLDSYDMGWNAITKKYELRYTLFWTALAYKTNATAAEKKTDDLRQLGYRNPDESAIVTWCSYHFSSGTEGGYPARGDASAQVLRLDGSVKAVDQNSISTYGWGFKF